MLLHLGSSEAMSKVKLVNLVSRPQAFPTGESPRTQVPPSGRTIVSHYSIQMGSSCVRIVSLSNRIVSVSPYQRKRQCNQAKVS